MKLLTVEELRKMGIMCNIPKAPSRFMISELLADDNKMQTAEAEEAASMDDEIRASREVSPSADFSNEDGFEVTQIPMNMRNSFSGDGAVTEVELPSPNKSDHRPEDEGKPDLNLG